MNIKIIRRPLLIAGATVVLLVILGLMARPGTPADANNVFTLQAPPFAGIARAEAGAVPGIIEAEAGISAWFQASSSINLNSVRSVFRTIEAETTDYIIGSVPVANYTEYEDVHVYVHKDGWILAYYLAQDPTGKIYDWIAYHAGGRSNISTKLENTIAVVANAAQVPFSGVTYYDFRSPNATHLMMIVEWVQSIISGTATDSFQARLPGSFVYYERSWSLGNSYDQSSPCHSWYVLNGAEIERHDHSSSSWWISHGALTVSQLPPDQYHWIEVRSDGQPSKCFSYGGLALVYRMP